MRLTIERVEGKSSWMEDRARARARVFDVSASRANLVYYHGYLPHLLPLEVREKRGDAKLQ